MLSKKVREKQHYPCVVVCSATAIDPPRLGEHPSLQDTISATREHSHSMDELYIQCFSWGFCYCQSRSLPVPLLQRGRGSFYFVSLFYFLHVDRCPTSEERKQNTFRASEILNCTCSRLASLCFDTLCRHDAVACWGASSGCQLRSPQVIPSP